jgi:WD40 repeat protein
LTVLLRLSLIFFFLTGCSGQSSTPVASWRHADDGAYAADVSADASLAVVSSVTGGISVWDLQKNEKRYTWQHQGEGNNLVANVHIAFDNSYVVTSDRDAFALWSITSGEPEGFWRIDESSIRDVAVSNQGRGILVGRGNGKVMFFEPKSGRRLEFLGHQEKVNSVDLSPNGFYALTGGNDYTAYLWDTRTGQVIHTFTHSSRVTKVALDDEGRYGFTADSKRDARVWDLATGEEMSNLQYLARQKIFSTAVFSQDGQYLLTGSPAKRLNLWRVADGKEVQEWQVSPREGSRPQTAVVYGVGFANDNQVVSESSSGLAEFWQINQ